MSDKFYLDMNGNTAGPFSLDHVRTLYLSGAVNDSTLYSQPDAVQWLPLSTIAPLLRPSVPPPILTTPAPPSRPMARRGDFYCPACGTVNRPITGPAPGSFAVELLLWLFFCAPGMIYSAWRIFSRPKVCPTCKSPAMIPAHSPVARAKINLGK